jgi:hypothetical protein
MRRPTAALVAACVLALAGTVTAQPGGVTSEYQLKAAYLVNFARFVEWPGEAASEEGFSICVLGADPFGPLLESTFANLSVAGQRVIARRLTAVEEAEDCRVLFISPSETARLPEILEALRGLPVLTVSDMAQFARQGGMIQFVRAGDRVRFEVDLRAAQDAGLMLSSSLLRVAMLVRPGVRR